MQSIAGIYHFDGRAVEPWLLEQMLAQMGSSTPGHRAVWSDGPVGLGWLHTGADTPSAQTTQLGAGVPVVADARIDNRADLAAGLGDDASTVRRMSDAELIAAAYAKWGADFPAKLVGDYAFALWDAHRRTLVCGRDHFGVRPFYYYLGPDCFAFASELRGVLACPGVPHDLYEVRIGLHLAVLVADKDSTFYRHIKRLAPAHWLRVAGRDAVTSGRYWSLDNTPELRLGSSEDYAEAFREVFTEAVRCRLPDATPIASLLSGGLDSTAVTNVARRLIHTADPLHTFSAVFDRTPECDERRYVQATLDLGGFAPHNVAVEAVTPLTHITAMLAAVGEPFTAPTMYILWELYRAVNQLGFQVLLDGIDGDTAVHHGDDYLATLARAGRWDEFFRQGHGLAEHSGHSVDLLMKRYGEPHLRDLAYRQRWRQLYRELRAVAPHSNARTARLLYYYGLRPLARRYRRDLGRALGKPAPSAMPRLGLANAQLARETDLVARVTAYQDRIGAEIATAQQEHHRLLEAPLLTHVFELSTQAGRAFGVDTRHPFADRRVVEFCYALPAQHKLVDGWTRHIVRQGLTGVLPEAIRLRGDKTENSAAVTKAMQTRDAGHLDQIIDGDQPELTPYVDQSALKDAYQRYRRTGSRQDEMLVWQATTLAIWLRQAGGGHLRPATPRIDSRHIDRSQTHVDLLSKTSA